jgi:hypothetical protein
MKYRGTIAYRCGLGGHVPEGFLASVGMAMQYWYRENKLEPDFYFMRGLSCMPHDAANQIAEMFLGDWVLYLDTDHVFRSDAFHEMIQTFEENNLDILVGFAQKRQPPYTPVIYKTNFDPLMTFERIIPKGLDRHQLIPIDASGLACTMIHRRVFDGIKQSLHELPFDFRNKFRPPVPLLPTPRTVYSDINNYRLGNIPKDRRTDEFYWEDISFFWRAALLGFKAWCAPWIKFHHIEQRLVTDDLIQEPKPDPIPR